MHELGDELLLRYSRQILLPQFDVQGQQKVCDSRVLVVGCGGLGSPVALYLAAAGVGHLVLADHDRVDLTNLQRQVVYSSDDVGLAKVDAARSRLLALNPTIAVTALHRRLEGDDLIQQVAKATVIVDATDNFSTRFALNDACVRARKPLVSAAAIRLEAQVSVFSNQHPASPCYRCLYRDEGDVAETCSQTGILGPVVGIIGSIQALEVLKLIAGIGKTLDGRLLLFDAQFMEWRTVLLRKDPHCPVCAEK